MLLGSGKEDQAPQGPMLDRAHPVPMWYLLTSWSWWEPESPLPKASHQLDPEELGGEGQEDHEGCPGLAFAGLEQTLPASPRTIGIDAVGVRVDEIDGDPQVWLSQEVVFVLFLQGSCFVLNKPGWEHMPVVLS